jgi:hypothetical protein
MKNNLEMSGYDLNILSDHYSISTSAQSILSYFNIDYLIDFDILSNRKTSSIFKNHFLKPCVIGIGYGGSVATRRTARWYPRIREIALKHMPHAIILIGLNNQ